MPARLHPRTLALALLGGLVALPAPGFAQSVGIDFGASASDEFLDGGGGFDVRAPARSDRGRSRDVDRARPRAYETRRSVTHAPSRPDSTYYRGTGIFANANPVGGSVIYVNAPPPQPAFGTSGPRIIDVEAERLDRSSVRPGGISITFVGSAKIIRLASDEGRASTVHDRNSSAPPPPRAHEPALPYDVDPPAAPTTSPERAASADARFLEPWSDAWRRDCEARHRSFDAALGTYLGADGIRRFCTGEPS